MACHFPSLLISGFSLCALWTIDTGSLAAGYGFSYLVATGIVLIAMVLVATQLNHKACQSELTRQRQEAARTRTDVMPDREAQRLSESAREVGGSEQFSQVRSDGK
ncbi:MAG TPA: hypothetical protein VF026_12345 [Ktedonobacteraceae bacterium]